MTDPRREIVARRLADYGEERPWEELDAETRAFYYERADSLLAAIDESSSVHAAPLGESPVCPEHGGPCYCSASLQLGDSTTRIAAGGHEPWIERCSTDEAPDPPVCFEHSDPRCDVCVPVPPHDDANRPIAPSAEPTLNDEIAAWERASDEALAKAEKPCKTCGGEGNVGMTVVHGPTHDSPLGSMSVCFGPCPACSPKAEAKCKRCRGTGWLTGGSTPNSTVSRFTCPTCTPRQP